MTPQERQRVADLFERLARLENSPREREAEELIMEGLRYAPNSPYAMVQTILVQEEALERANARVQELEMQGGAEPAQASSQHKVESVQGKHLTSGQIKGESVTCAQTKVESVQGKHRASTQIKGEGATCAQVKIESQQHKVESRQHKVEPKVAQPQA